MNDISRSLSAVLLILLPILCLGAISSAEYYFNDQDGGAGNNTPLAVTVTDGQASLSETIDLTASGLTAGLHMVSLRFQDNTNGWGPSRGIPFLILDSPGSPEITDAEYFFDADDAGPGNNTSINIGSAGSGINLSSILDISSLSPGVHSASLRLYSPEAGGYGPVRSVLFRIAEDQVISYLQAAEYYIGSPANKVTVPSPVDGTFDELVESIQLTETEIPAGLNGVQPVGVRFQDGEGAWGPWITTNLLIRDTSEIPTISAAEVFVDSDPGIGQATPVEAPVDGVFDEAVEEFNLPVALDALSEGTHVAYLRLKRSDGNWGVPRGSVFKVSEEAQPVIAAAEYFTNPSTAEGSGTAFTPLDGAFNSLEEEVSTTVSIASLGLDVGTHTMYVRFQNSQGAWGPVSSTNFSVETRPQITVSLHTLDFGSLFTGETRSLSLTLGNIGDEDLVVSDLDFSDNAYTGNWTGGSIPPNDSVLVEITFAPVDPAASHPATLTITNNDANQTVVLLGTGLDTAPIMAVEPDSLDFGTVQTIGSATLAVRVSNSGNEDLVLTSPTVTDAAFSVAIPNPTVVPDSYVDVDISFAPSIAGTYTDTVFLNSNDTYFPAYPIHVAGIGTDVPVPNIQVSADRLDFGNIALEDPPVQETLTIQNTGTLALNISALTIDEPAFTSDVTGAQVIDPAGSLTLTLTFTPANSQVYTGTLTISNDDPDSPSMVVDLRGSSVFPDMVLSTNTFQFGEIGVTTNSTQSLIITNIGSDTLKISEFQNSAGIDTVVSITPPSINVLPGGQQAFSVTFAPAEPIVYSGMVIISSNDDPDTLYISGTGLDDEAPEITFDPGDIENAGTRENSPVVITAPIVDNNQIAWVRLFYRQGGKASYDSLEMTAGPGGYSGTIPAAYVVNRGVEYYLAAYDGANLQTVPATAPEIPAVVRVRVPSLPAFTFQAQKYGMFSVPTDLDSKGVQDILEGNLGEYDVNAWRLFRWVNGNYVELTDRPDFAFDPGKAYWLITAGRQVINMDSSTSVATNEDYLLSLDQGWNQVATPFYFPVAWSDVYENSPNVVQGLVAYEWVNDDWVEADQLEPFKGYFIYTPSTNILRYPPREANQGVPRKPAQPLALEEGEWAIRLSASTPMARDESNYAGVRTRAERQLDILDRPEAPRPGNAALQVYFEHDWPGGPSRYSADFHPFSPEGQVWDLTVNRSRLHGEIDLQLEPFGELPEHHQLLLLDLDVRTILASGQLEETQLILPYYPGLEDQHLRLLVGTEGFLQAHSAGIGTAPESFTLEENYPNPFNGSTLMHYAVAEPSAVRLSIFDLRGREVAILVHDQLHPVGNYLATWDGRDAGGHRVASGMYLTVLRTPHETITRKLVLLK